MGARPDHPRRAGRGRRPGRRGPRRAVRRDGSALAGRRGDRGHAPGDRAGRRPGPGAAAADPLPGPGELLLAPEVAGVCGTDLQMLRGLRDDEAPVIGHEGVARVVLAGAGAAPVSPGHPGGGQPDAPHDPSFLLGHNVDGLLQERTLVPATAVRDGLVFALPGQAPEPELAALLEPLAVVRHALSALATGRPRTLLVIGDGTVGHLAVRAAHRWLGPGYAPSWCTTPRRDAGGARTAATGPTVCCCTARPTRGRSARPWGPDRSPCCSPRPGTPRCPGWRRPWARWPTERR
ncbi:alcohol dehydrogenase catalytic domain-containing protein [Streptomyces sp. M19]